MLQDTLPCSYVPEVSNLIKPALKFMPYLDTTAVYTYNAIILAWVSNNIKPDHKRSAAIPLLLSVANVSGVVASQVYPDFTAPR